MDFAAPFVYRAAIYSLEELANLRNTMLKNGYSILI
ncbi:MAG: hypothetical protein RLY18_79 [Pseudomonadota bacterium]|jgi:hypothetical protein